MKDKKDVDQKPADTINPSTSKRQRGRPRKNGAKSGEWLARAMWGLHVFDTARRAGMKYEAALAEAAKEIGSSSEMKRICATFRPKGAEFGVVTAEHFKPTAPEKAELFKLLGPPEAFWKNSHELPVTIGPVPKYPRANARDDPETMLK